MADNVVPAPPEPAVLLRDTLEDRERLARVYVKVGPALTRDLEGWADAILAALRGSGG